MMNYLAQIRSIETCYKSYLEIKEKLRNTYMDLVIDYSQNHQLSFKRNDTNVIYQLYKKSDKHHFRIINDSKNLINCELTKSNLVTILQAIDITRPSEISKSAVFFNAKLCNRYTTRRFDEQYLLNMTSWKKNKLSDGKYTKVLPDGYIYKGHSNTELKILDYLVTKGCAKIVRGQDYAIPYGEQSYYPDFVYLNHLNQIVILEVKGKSDFSTESNLIKYIALAEHCYENGYVYGFIDENFVTMKSYLNIKQNRGFEDAVLHMLKKDGIFNSQSLTKLKNSTFQHLKRSHLMKLLTKLVIEHQYINRPKTVHDLNIINKKLDIENFNLIEANSH